MSDQNTRREKASAPLACLNHLSAVLSRPQGDPGWRGRVLAPMLRLLAAPGAETIAHTARVERAQAALRSARPWALDLARRGGTIILPLHVWQVVDEVRRSARTRRPPDDPAGLALLLAAALRTWIPARSAIETLRGALAEEREAAREASDALLARITAAAREHAEVGSFGERAPGRMEIFLVGVPGAGRLAGDAARRAGESTDAIGTAAEEEALARRVAEASVEFLARIGTKGKDMHRGLSPDPWPTRSSRSIRIAASRAHAAKIAYESLDPTCHGSVFMDDGFHAMPRSAVQRDPESFARRLPLIETESGRRTLRSLPFTPIPKRACKLNLRDVFRPEYWSALSGNLVALRGGVCCVCGCVVGHMSIGGWPTPRMGAIEVHEAWDWEVADPERRIGVQRLVSLLPVCRDCHSVFHVDQVSWKTRKHVAQFGGSPVEMEALALDYLLGRRAAMLEGLAELPHVAAAEARRAEIVRCAELQAAVDHWILDLAAVNLLPMAGAEPVFDPDPSIRVEQEGIGGIAFLLPSGERIPPSDVDSCLRNVAALLDDRARVSVVAPRP